MLAIDQPYALLLIFAALISAFLTVSALTHRPSLVARSFSILMASVSMWAWVSFFEFSAVHPRVIIFSYHLKYIFIVIVPLAWLIFCLTYANRVHRFSKNLIIIFMMIPVVTIVMVGTNQFHHLMFQRFDIVVTDRHVLLCPTFGSLFWAYTVYSHAILVTGFVYLAKHLVDLPTRISRQSYALVIGGMVPWISNLFFIFGIDESTVDFDFTPVAFSISGIAFMWGILRCRLLDIKPIARDVVIQNMLDGIIVVDIHENIVDINRAARRLSHLAVTDPIDIQAKDAIAWWKQVQTCRAQTLKGVQPIIELKLDGHPHFLKLRCSPIYDKSQLIGHIISLHDVTDTQIAQHALKESEARFKSLSENAPVIMFALDENKALSYVNPAWKNMLGHCTEDLLGRPFTDFVNAQRKDELNAILNKILKAEISTAEVNFHIYHQNGSQCLFNTHVSAKANMAGQVTGIVGLAKDITEEQELQHQLIESQKMEAIGTLAGGIAHDFNNLLMGIQANLSLLRLDKTNAPSCLKKIVRIENQIQNGAALTRQLLGYARKGKSAPTSFDLNVLIQDTLSVVNRTNKGIITYHCLSEQPAMLIADQGQIELVLLNLFINAVDAMPDSGRLTVTTRLSRQTCGQHTDFKGTNTFQTHIEVTISDTGVGMDQATQDQIFEPFFTTKERGRGTGLGLASVYAIINSHGGTIQVSSTPNSGSKFTILLPATHSLPLQCALPLKKIMHLNGNGTILLVDDEPLILQYCQEMIKSLGYKVITAQNAQEAMHIYRVQGAQIDVTILDLIMPQISGLQLLKMLETINPQAKTILSTGHVLDRQTTNKINGRYQCLRKPYTIDELACAIHKSIHTQADIQPRVQSGAK